MTVPVLTFEVAFGVAPGVVPTGVQWVDLSARLRERQGVVWGYGRGSELDRMEAGTGSVTLDNTDRELDPANEASAYWPNVQPMVRCRLVATVPVTGDVQIFEGFIEAWQPSWPGKTDSVVELPIVDGTKLLSMARTSAAYSAEASGTRVGNLLDAAGWPATARTLDDGESDVQAYDASDRVVLNAISDAVATEDGVFLIGPDGNARFRDRYSRVVSTSQATFGDGVGELPYDDLLPSFDDERLWNDVAVTANGLTVQRASSSDSETSFGPRFLELSTLHTTELEAADFASWLIGRYSTPRLRVDSIVLHGHTSNDVLDECVARTPGDRVTIKRRPPGGGDPIVLEVFIESVRHRISGDEWVTTWGLSPAFSEVVWRIGIAGASEIGETTRLGY